MTQTALDAIDVQAEKYRTGRLKLIEARVAAQTAELQAASAKTSQATASKRRSDHLQRTGDISGAESDRVQYEWSAATAAEAAARKRLEETQVEHDAVADGVFVGDSYNDSPSSAQRETELKLKKGELDAELAAVGDQIQHLGDQISQEEARYRLRSEAVVGLPTKGRVWETLVGPGEYVNKGQDLLRVLDCSHPIVSANVDERVSADSTLWLSSGTPELCYVTRAHFPSTVTPPFSWPPRLAGPIFPRGASKTMLITY